MPRLIITALVLLAALAYAVLFTTWNLEPVKVVGWRMAGQELWESIPLAYVALGGVAVGVLAMVIASLFVWVGQRSQIKKITQQVQRAREVIQQQRKRIDELEAALADAQQQLQAASEPLLVVEAEDVADEQPSDEASAEERQPQAPAAEDDEII